MVRILFLYITTMRNRVRFSVLVISGLTLIAYSDVCKGSLTSFRCCILQQSTQAKPTGSCAKSTFFITVGT